MIDASPLLSAAELWSCLNSTESQLVVLDASFDLQDAQSGRRAFEQGHVPGARYADLDADLCGAKTGRNGRHPLPARERFAATVGGWGIGPQTRVVVYDRQGAMFAARLWWMLRWLGHDDVVVLDGGWAAWQAAGGAVEGGAAAAVVDAGPYPERPTLMPTLDALALQARLGAVCLVDARAPERYRGEVEPLDAAAGHIPGALNRFFQLNLVEGRFKPAATLRAEFSALLGERPVTEMVHSCGSGVTACHNLLAMHVAGLPGAGLYPGSWSEWSADPARPVAKG
ncbi:sulfurtransferase [Aquabacterium sp.]|uniref:sulfurtransferase n=1 Tax=Aquabacterium sp. TaxID=1872578 RepID=UPI0035AED907